MANIYHALKPDERRMMGVLSIFLGAIERELAEHVLDAEGVTDIVQRLESLMHRHLIDEDESERLHCHSLVRDYCYHILNRRDRERFHQLAAEYYEQERNYLSAAYHHFERKAYAQALDLLTTNSQAIINGGGAATLIEPLKRFRRQDLNLDQRIALSKALGEGYQIRGEYQAAIQAYESALGEAPTELIRAELLRLIGNTHLKVGAYEQALEYAARSLATSQATEDHSNIAAAHLDMGWACFRLVRMAEASEHFNVSRQIGQELKAPLLLAKVYAGVGMVAWKTGRLDEARARLEDSLRIYRDHHDRTGEADTMGNLGLLYGEMGGLERQMLYYQQALEIQESIGDVDGLRIAFNNLGYLYYSKGDYDQAATYYNQLVHLAHDTGHQPMLSIAYAGLADAYRNLDQLSEALVTARKAVQIASELSSVMELGVSYRALGDVWLSLSEWVRAREAFESSLPLLERAHEEIEMNRARQGYSVANASLADAQSRHIAGG
ncbi:MAG TPA: tetratricopeptide repeat protein [Anaerolineae bacterium]